MKKRYKWDILVKIEGLIFCICPKCEKAHHFSSTGEPNYCPNCGEKMVEDVDNGYESV